MPQARYRLVDIHTTPYYHCISRCVRRAYLCGYDRFSGKNFDHRKQWILDRIQLLSSVFAIDVCAYAIMSNHFHLVLHVDSEKAQAWTVDEVIDHWLTLYKGPELAHKYKASEVLTGIEQDAISVLVEVWRARLGDLSWYMRCLNEAVARMANEEEECTGRFWEGRFTSQALLDEAALISCMVYVDLNPIRACLSESLEDSEFTSIQERLIDNQKKQKDTSTKTWLKPLAQRNQPLLSNSLPIEETSYFYLVDWTGRAVRDDKRGAIPAHIQPILQKLAVNEDNWVNNTQHFGSRFRRALGRISQFKKLASRTNSKWINGLSPAKQFYK
ncbi:MAG: REP element-mobilizing transposase RayT [Glaciecola sp.]|jgi:REP element-mobilizing transposase RayT